jgi:arylsulfatase A-like enzyme
LVRWPAGLPAGTTYRAPVAHVDVFATAAAAAGARLPADRRIDGVDLLPFLRGAQTGRPHETLFWRSGHYRAIRVGDWKLQVSERPPRTWLFDLTTDPSEHTDLAQREPERVAELRAVLAATEREMVAPAWPALLEGPVPIDHPMNGPDDPADEYVYWPN